MREIWVSLLLATSIAHVPSHGMCSVRSNELYISRQPIRGEEGKTIYLPVHFILHMALVKSLPMGINSPGRCDLGFPGIQGKLKLYYLKWAMPPITFEPILYLESFLISESLFFKDGSQKLSDFRPIWLRPPIRPIWLRPPCWSEWGTSQNPLWQIEGEALPSRDAARGSSQSFQCPPLWAKAGLSVPRHSSNRVPPGTTLLCNFHMAPSLRVAMVYSLALTEIPRTLKIFNTIPFSA